MTKLLPLLLLFALSVSGAKPPKNIDEAIAYFEKTWTEKKKEEFKSKPERTAVLDAHHSVGMWIRNEWIRGKRDTLLTNQFNDLGIYHPDDMSSIILTSLHRKLNNKPIDIEGQVQQYKDYWKPIHECQEKAEQAALLIYNNFNITDSIEIQMYVDGGSPNGNAVTFACPTTDDWAFDTKKDLLIKGVVVDKYSINSETNVFFRIRISYLNFPDTKIYMKEVRPGDIYDFHLEHLRVRHLR